ncbi:hypothetical protein N825_21600 [Skermanella stibiiresistens SB22]|uniref:Flagellar hook-length control protein-like C-terminal domain-containing protein n=1 Tax=Skermanella stibiiresistens SB22 TaxID=1385369 RepID=W9GTI3_9PROT|nr:flagellar hook-length control protein FliK [Skermanella stibiiresistens]EWY37185.1 hypothetical protein N825_21600 [Skermanella stibiiresistens SB22]
MEITQTNTMPSAASAGSASGTTAASGETPEDGGFLALVGTFMAAQAGQRTSSSPDEGVPADKSGKTEQDDGAVPDGLLSLIAPGLFSNLMIPQTQPRLGTGETPAGTETTEAAIPASTAPLPAAPAGSLPMPPALAPDAPVPDAPVPDAPVEGEAPQSGGTSGTPGQAAAAKNAEIQDDTIPLGDKELAQLIERGKAQIEAKDRKESPAPVQDKREAPVQTLDRRETPVQAQPAVPVQVQVQASAQPQQPQASAQPQQPHAPVRNQAPDQRLPNQGEAVRDDTAPVVATPTGVASAPVTVQMVRQPTLGEAGVRPAKSEQDAVVVDADAASVSEDADTMASAETLVAEDASSGDASPEKEGRGEADGRDGREAGQRQSARGEGAMQRQPEASGQASGSVTGKDNPSPVAGATEAKATGIVEDGPAVAAKGRSERKGAGGFEDALAAAGGAPVNQREPDPVMAAQAPGHSLAEAEAIERTAAPHGRNELPKTPGEQVSVQLGKAVSGKSDQMVINLKPVELGNVEVKLDFGADGKVQASIMADRPETLAMLQKDQRTLERALTDAGLQTDSGSLSFSLKDQGGNQRQFAGYNPPSDRRGRSFGGIGGDLGPIVADPTQWNPGGGKRDRLDIRI